MSNLRVLAVDDSKTNRVILKNFLEADHAEVFLAETGAEGTALAREHRPDVIVLDVVLPDADGVELCREWRTDPELMDIPVLLISGERIADEDRAEGLRSGALGYLLKPFTDIGLLSQVHLLHQLAQTHKQLKNRNAELEASNQELEQFAYVVSHDLKSPLRTITGYCKLLAKHCAEQFDTKAGDLMQIVLGGTDRMQQLIDDLLTYSRVGRIGQAVEAVDLAETLNHVVDNLDAAIEESGATIDIDALPVVGGSPLQRDQLFQNLIDNAIKFQGEDPPRIHISAQQTEERWQVTVADNGIGIEAKYFDEIFGVFQRLHTREEYAGTGIGLALCQKIVHHQGGRLWVESEPGKGSKFHVELSSQQS